MPEAEPFRVPGRVLDRGRADIGRHHLPGTELRSVGTDDPGSRAYLQDGPSVEQGPVLPQEGKHHRLRLLRDEDAGEHDQLGTVEELRTEGLFLAPVQIESRSVQLLRFGVTQRLIALLARIGPRRIGGRITGTGIHTEQDEEGQSDSKATHRRSFAPLAGPRYRKPLRSWSSSIRMSGGGFSISGGLRPRWSRIDSIVKELLI